jgi:hypothetical protein
MMGSKTTPLNTLERALSLAQSVCREFKAGDRKIQRSYRVFSAFTHDDGEAWAALLIWKALGKTFKELLHDQ